jgi:plasmid stability protein
MDRRTLVYYTVFMRTTLTIRTDEKLRAALKERAAMQGKSVSEVAREILSEAVAERPLSERVGHLKGKLDLRASDTDAWRERLRERNWRS